MPVPGGPNNRIPPEGFHQDLSGDPRIKRRTNTLNSSLAKILHEKEHAVVYVVRLQCQTDQVLDRSSVYQTFVLTIVRSLDPQLSGCLHFHHDNLKQEIHCHEFPHGLAEHEIMEILEILLQTDYIGSSSAATVGSVRTPLIVCSTRISWLWASCFFKVRFWSLHKFTP